MNKKKTSVDTTQKQKLLLHLLMEIMVQVAGKCRIRNPNTTSHSKVTYIMSNTLVFGYDSLSLSKKMARNT